MQLVSDEEVCPLCSGVGCFEVCIEKAYEWYIRNYPSLMAVNKRDLEALKWKPELTFIPADYSDLPF